MSDISGPGGGVTLPTGFVIHVQGWTARQILTDVETTGFVEIGNRTFDATALHFEGNATGTGQTGTSSTLVPTAALGTSPTFSSYKAALTLTAASGVTWAFSAIIRIDSMRRMHDGKYDVDLAFKSSGAITMVNT